MKYNYNPSPGGIGILEVILIVNIILLIMNIILKFAKLINWSWSIILLPLWINLILIFIAVIFFIIIYLWYRR